MRTSVNGLDLLGIDNTQFTVQGMEPSVDAIQAALADSGIDFSGADFTAADLAGALAGSAYQLIFDGDISGSNITSALSPAFIDADIDLGSAGIDPGDIAAALNGMDLPTDLPADGSVYSITNFGNGFYNVYAAIANDDGTAAASIHDTLVTPWGNFDIPTDYDAVAPLDVGAGLAGLGLNSDATGLSDNAFTVGDFTFDPGSDGFNTVAPLFGAAPLLEMAGGRVSLGGDFLRLGQQNFQVYGDDGTDLGSAHTTVNMQNLLGIDSTQFTIAGVHLDEADYATAVADADIDFDDANFDAGDVAAALADKLDNDLGEVTGAQVNTALAGSGIFLSHTDIDPQDIADAINGVIADYAADLPDQGTVYSVTDLGSGFANVYVATPDADGTAAASISDTLVTPFGNFDIPIDYDAIANLDPGSVFAALGAADDVGGEHAFTIDGTTFDPGADGFHSVKPLFGIAPLLEIGGGQNGSFVTMAPQHLEVYDDTGADLGRAATSVNTLNLFGLIDNAQFTVQHSSLGETEYETALSDAGINFDGLDFDANDVATALADSSEASLSLGHATGRTVVLAVYNTAGINLQAAGVDYDAIADAINAISLEQADNLDPYLGAVYSVTDFGFGITNVYAALPDDDGDAAGSIHDTLITPFGDFDLSTMFDAIAFFDPGDAAGGVSDVMADGAFNLFDPSTWF